RGQALREALERHCLAGPGRARDQAVAIGPAEVQELFFAVAGKPEKDFTHLPILLPSLSPHGMGQGFARGQVLDLSDYDVKAGAMRERTPFVLLDDARTEGAAGVHLYENPVEIFVAYRADEVDRVLAA